MRCSSRPPPFHYRHELNSSNTACIRAHFVLRWQVWPNIVCLAVDDDPRLTIRYTGLPFRCRNALRQGFQLRGLIVQKTILFFDQLPQSSDEELLKLIVDPASAFDGHEQPAWLTRGEQYLERIPEAR